jgi:hypothetical protein
MNIETNSKIENLVPKSERYNIKTGGKTPFQVLVWHTDFEWKTTELESDIKGKIVARFADYDDALAFAEEKSKKSYLFKVTVR